MKPHRLEAMGIRRGDAPKLARALGHTSPVVARRYTREPAAPDNLSTGSPSPAARAEMYLVAAGTVNPDIPCNWIGRFMSNARIQQAVRAGVTRGEALRVLAADVIRRSAALTETLLSEEASDEEKEEAALRLISAGVRVIYNVAPEDDLPPAKVAEFKRAA